MSKITDATIFNSIRNEVKDGKLTQPIVEVVNLAIDHERDKVIDILEIPEPEPFTRPYNLTPDTLRKVYKDANTSVIPYILKHAPSYGIITKKQMCAFIATCLVESRGFTAKRESMAYRATTLTKVFSKKLIPSLAFANNLVAEGQVAIANHLYNGRMGNRNGTNDGWAYRGGGWIQLTGRSNYFEMGNLIGVPLGAQPELIEDIDISCKAAMQFWQLNGLNEKAEKINIYANGWELNTLNSRGVETNDYNMNTGIRLVRKTVNGGYNGLKEVAELFEECMKHM